MVRTRHNGDPSNDAVTPPRFLTLEERRSTKSRIHTIDADGNESDHNGVDYDGEHSIFEEKIVESRLRPRVGPRRAYNYVYEDSSDDDTTLLMSWRTRKARVVNETSFQMSGSRRQQHKVCKLDHTSEEDQDSPSRCSSKKLSHVPVEREDDDELSSEDGNLEENFNNNARRTSSRPRKVPLRYCVVTEKPTSQGLTDGNNVEVGGSARTKRHQPSDPPENADEDYEDMYSRVKRPRNKKTVDSVSNTDASTDEGDDEGDTEDEAQPKPYYSLRQRKPRTLYSAPVREASKKKPKLQETPPRTKKRTGAYRSPAHRSSKFRKQEAFHGSSSSTSSEQSEDGPDTIDEQRFSRRRERSIVKAKNRIMPLNFSNDTVAGSAIKRDRVRAGASLADVDPMEIDTSVTFDSIGGLAQHLMVLKEMIVFPLLYPEFYKKFNVTPCRGVIFHGPPGTGKTLVARALANECSRGSERVAFFMRKGADCLSKWVGEAERQLRLLFDKAYEMRPSIIFFDEIDGLAPVRSSRQDQIHSSIVSTLLALMDGLDSRGEIIVIGATNRIDAIDPGLRRPGRFDKEFHFPLPNLEDRKKILRIHTRDWKPGLCDEFISELALRCAGYCGADIKCLVTDATQNALRRHYPQIYTTSEKLQIDVDSITLSARDFAQALAKIVPTAHRAASSPAMPLESSMQPLLQRPLSALLSALARLFPYAKLERKVELLDGLQGQSREGMSQEELTYELSSDEEESTPSIFVTENASCQNAFHGNISSRSSFIKCSAGMNGFPKLYRPRMLVAGESGQGQTVHLAPAALHLMEDLPVYTLSAASIFGASARLPEEECTNVFREAERTAPSIIYMPSIEELWTVASDTLRSTFLSLVRLMQPSTPVLLFATSELPYSDLDGQLKKLFNKSRGQVVEVEGPMCEERRQFFSDLILLQPLRPPPACRLAARRIMQELPKAAPPEPRKLTEPEEHRLFEQEEDTLRELRIFLREILSKLWREKKFSIFTKPVDREEVPDYYDIIKNPVDLSMVMSKIDQHKYTTAAAFMEDIYLICSNALEYNPVKGSADRQIRHRACALRDTADALLKAELDPEFEKICLEISQSRKRRGVDSSGMVPAFCHTYPLIVAAGNSSATSTSNNPSHVSQAPEGSRYSRRVRGLDVDSVVPLDLVEKSAQVEKSLLNKSVARDNSKDTCGYQVGVEQQPQEDSMDTEEEPIAAEKVCSTPPSTKPCQPEKNSFKGHCENARALSSSMIKRINMRKKCPWLATRRRRRPHSAFSQKDSHSPGSDLEVHSADECEEILIPVRELNSQGERAELTDHEHLSQPCVSANNSTLMGLTKLVAQSVAHRTSGCTRSSSTVAFLEASCQNRLNNTSSLVHGHDSCAEQTGPQASTCAVSSSEGSSDVVNQGSALNKQLEMELNAVATDSGVGSSLDSNGDSRDSIENNNNNNKTGSVTSKRSCKKDENLADKSSPGPHTQHLQTAGQSNALLASQTVMANINVDKVRLSMLLELTVEKTRQCTVETLQELYSVLNCIIFRHRWSLDKMQLIKDLEEAVAVYGR